MLAGASALLPALLAAAAGLLARRAVGPAHPVLERRQGLLGRPCHFPGDVLERLLGGGSPAALLTNLGKQLLARELRGLARQVRAARGRHARQDRRRGALDHPADEPVATATILASLIAIAGQLALIRLALSPSITVGGAIGHGIHRLPIYFLAALIIIVRVTGKRQVGQLAPFDLVLLLVLSNAVQNSMNGGDNSLIGGLISAVTLIALNYGVGVATFKSKRVAAIIEGRPVIIVHNGKVFEDVLAHVQLTHHELMAALRQNGCGCVEEVQSAILENNGAISVVPRSTR